MRITEMMKLKKLLLTLVLLPLMALADTETVDGITWTYAINDGKVEVGKDGVGGLPTCAVPRSTTGAISIPPMLGGCPVTKIGDFAFSFCSNLTAVTIPLSVTSIEHRAFANCSGLTSVTIPLSVKRIEDGAFAGCSGLKSFVVPSSVERICDSAFAGCSGLKSVRISKGVTSIESDAFYECKALESVLIPSSVSGVGVGAFWGCSELTTLTIPKSVTYIGDWAFFYCPLNTIIVDNGDADRIRGVLDEVSFDVPGRTYVERNVNERVEYLTTIFNPNGGLISQEYMVLLSGSKLDLLPTATRSGYTFDGWYTSASGGTKVSASTTVMDNLTLYAHWTKNAVNFTVTFNANGGSCSISSKSYVSGSTLGTLPTATRSGYSFEGWYTSASGGTKVSASTMVPGDMTLYAHWAQNAVNYTVTFNANGGACSTLSKSYASGATLGTLPTATRSGYSFEGWYTSASGGTKVSASTTVTGDMTLYAHWKIVVDKDAVQNEWYAAYSDHAVPSWVMVGGDQVYVGEVSFPYVFPSSGAVLNRTQGGYRVDLKGVLLKPGPWTSNVIDADGDLSIYLEGENVIEGQVHLSGRGGVLDPLPSSHRLLIFGPGKLTMLGEGDGMNSAIYADDAVSVMAGATVSIYGERIGIGTRLAEGDVLISGSMVGVYGSSYRAIECENLRVLAAMLSVRTTHQGIYARGDITIDAAIVNAFTPQICVHGANLYASHSYLALAATALDDSLSSHSVLQSGEVLFDNCVAKIVGFAPSTVQDARCIDVKNSTDYGVIEFGEGDYYIGLKAKRFSDNKDLVINSCGVFADAAILNGGNVHICAPGVSGVAADVDIESGMLEVQEDFDTAEMFEFDAGVVAAYTAAIGAGIFDASTASVDLYTQVFLDALSNGLMENIEGRASTAVYFGNGFYLQEAGTVLAEKTIHGIVTTKYPAIINGGSCQTSFQLSDVGKNGRIYYETVPCAVIGEEVIQNLKCVEYTVSGASKYDKISRSWDGVLPTYYGTGSLYADDGGKLYFWVPGNWVVTSVFTVTFDAQGGDVSENARNVKGGNAVGDLPKPTRSKYKFDGWYTAAVGGTKVLSSTKVTGDITYYAHWTYDGSATVTVGAGKGCADKGTASGGKTAKVGTKLTLKAMAKKGYVFAGWYRDAACENPIEGGTDYRSPSYSYVVGEDDATFYAKFIPVDDDWVSVWCQSADEYARGVEIEPLAVGVGSASLATVKVTGLPTGLKFTAKPLTQKATNNRAEVDLPANTIYGTPTKSGIYTATITAKTAGKKSETYNVDFVIRGDGEYLVDVMGLDGADYPDNGSDAQHAIQWGKMSGYGVFASDKTATLKATANRGYVFAGWFSEVACVCEGGEEDDGCIYTPAEGSVDYRSTSFPVKVGYEDGLYYARFVRAEDDDMLWANVEDAYYLNGPWSLKLDIESMSLPTVTVKGLPSGLKFNSKTLTIFGTPTKPGTYPITLSLKNATIKTARTQGFTLYVANIESPYLSGVDYTKDAYVYRVGTSMEFDIGSCARDGYSVTGVSGLPSGLEFDKNTGLVSGVPTKAGPKTVTITLKNGKLTSSATITLNVDAIDTWAYGTFNGGGEDGVLTLTVGNTGKISGKWMTVDGAWTLSAKSYESYDEDEQGCYRSLVAAKCGTKTAHFWLDAYDGRLALYEYLPTLCGYGPLAATAKRNVWKDDQRKDLAIQMKGASFALTDEVSLKVGSFGAVTATGKFVTGQNASGKDIVYSASCSTVLVPVAEDVFRLYLCFPKKNGKFGGRVLQEALEWNGSELSVGF